MTYAEQRNMLRKYAMQQMVACAQKGKLVDQETVDSCSALLQALALDQIAMGGDISDIGAALKKAGEAVSTSLDHMTGQLRYVSGR